MNTVEPVCVYGSLERERVELCQYQRISTSFAPDLLFSFENHGQPAFALIHFCYFTFRDVLGLNAPFNFHTFPLMGILADLTMPTVVLS